MLSWVCQQVFEMEASCGGGRAGASKSLLLPVPASHMERATLLALASAAGLPAASWTEGPLKHVVEVQIAVPRTQVS